MYCFNSNDVLISFSLLIFLALKLKLYTLELYLQFYVMCQCNADVLHCSVAKIFDFTVGKTSVVELTIACELDGVVVNIDIHNEPG